MAQNEMDTHADTGCAGSNWRILWYTGQVCEVSPFLPTYDAVNEIPVAGCGTVWSSPSTGQDYLLVGDQFLYFGEVLPNSLLNPNQLRAFGIGVNDNPFDESQDIGIDCGDEFIPLRTIGTNVYFESRVPTDWEVKHLPRIYITSDHWDPTDDSTFPEQKSREQIEMQTIKSMTSGMSRRNVMSLRMQQAQAQIETYGEIEHELGKISPVYNVKSLCSRIISSVKIAPTYREDIDQQDDRRKASGVITNDRHSKVNPKELARKWNIGLDTAKKTLEVTTQEGIRTAVHPMTR